MSQNNDRKYGSIYADDNNQELKGTQQKIQDINDNFQFSQKLDN